MKKALIPVMVLSLFLTTISCKKTSEKPQPVDPVDTVGVPEPIDTVKIPNGPDDGLYKIINRLTTRADLNLAIEVADASTDDGAKIKYAQFMPADNQMWQVLVVEKPYYKIINKATQKALTAADTTAGAFLTQVEYSGNSNQLWKIEEIDAGAFKISSKAGRMYVSLTNNGTDIQLQNAATGQEWFLQPDYLPEDNSTPQTTITWDTEAIKISHEGADVGNASYGRIHRVNSTTLILTYQYGAAKDGWEHIAIRRSTDNGQTWGEPHLMKKHYAYWGYSTPETIVLKNGWILLAFTGRHFYDTNTSSNIQATVSKDGGITWSPLEKVSYGRSWEPAMIELPNGEVQMYYSSESKWWPSAAPEQEIHLVRYKNFKWSEPEVVSYLPGMRDGMPVPLLLKDKKGIVFPVEAVNNPQSGYMIWSSLYSNWRYGDGLATLANGRRWLATVPGVWGGGPYIVQLPNGETVLSVHAGGGRRITNWRNNVMAVMIGNSVAKNFTNLSYPWPDMPVDEGTIENSLFLKDENTIIAVSSKIFPDGHSEIFWKKGTINYK